MVDHLGLISKVAITAANYHDQNGLRVLINALLENNESVPKLVYADQGYAGGPLENWMRERGLTLEIVERHRGWCLKERKLKPLKTFSVLPKRWVVERTFAWIGKQRRLSKDYEHCIETSESWIYFCMIRLMVRRIARENFDF